MHFFFLSKYGAHANKQLNGLEPRVWVSGRSRPQQALWSLLANVHGWTCSRTAPGHHREGCKAFYTSISKPPAFPISWKWHHFFSKTWQRRWQCKKIWLVQKHLCPLQWRTSISWDSQQIGTLDSIPGLAESVLGVSIWSLLSQKVNFFHSNFTNDVLTSRLMINSSSNRCFCEF